DNCIIFNYGMMPKKLYFFRKNSETDFDLVLIDGLGDNCIIFNYGMMPKKLYFFRKNSETDFDLVLIDG
ncbi:hypothetical protein D5K91_11185, partial [Arcobacter butzleri]|nr:hypothetical protein [Aliarcobacter butzleri]